MACQIGSACCKEPGRAILIVFIDVSARHSPVTRCYRLNYSTGEPNFLYSSFNWARVSRFQPSVENEALIGGRRKGPPLVLPERYVPDPKGGLEPLQWMFVIELKHPLLEGLVPCQEHVVAALEREGGCFRHERLEFVGGTCDVILGANCDQCRLGDARHFGFGKLGTGADDARSQGAPVTPRLVCESPKGASTRVGDAGRVRRQQGIRDRIPVAHAID